ncbi:putative quinol monooxygenase [Cupriavidus sp. D384]|uniref:putative quinol monooxygenase n=1 Tax=Cupriavidus sp. D384 TaxID=1538095 RepID=UPI00082A4312|nr:putative quinol monooxygenase [Cupriavidus sp. D384]
MKLLGLLSCVPLLSVVAPESAIAQGNPSATVVRIAQLEIDPARLEQYTRIVKEEIEISARDEPGVIAIYSVAEKDHPHRLHFFEIYASENAYLSHIASPHFKKYVEETKSMIRSRRLIETTPVQLSAK